MATVLVMDEATVAEPAIADFVAFSKPHDLPAAGKLGVVLSALDKGIFIDTLAPQSAARTAGIQQGDQVLVINDIPIRNPAEFKAMLWDKRPGDMVTVKVQRTLTCLRCSPLL